MIASEPNQNVTREINIGFWMEGGKPVQGTFALHYSNFLTFTRGQIISPACQIFFHL
jgi:hypothetical protein